MHCRIGGHVDCVECGGLWFVVFVVFCFTTIFHSSHCVCSLRLVLMEVEDWIVASSCSL